MANTNEKKKDVKKIIVESSGTLNPLLEQFNEEMRAEEERRKAKDGKKRGN